MRGAVMVDGRWAALAADLAARVSVQARMAEALVELDRHPGHAHLTGNAHTGETARRWTAARETVAALWQDFDLHRSALAEAVLAHGRGDGATLHRVLREPSIVVSRTAVPLPERGLTGAPERVDAITLSQLDARMKQAFTEVSTLVDEVWTARQAGVDRLADLAQQLQGARRLAAGLGTDRGTADELTRRLGDLERRLTSDPLGSGDGADAGIDTEIGALHRRLARIAAARDTWPQRLADLDAALAELDLLRARMDGDRARAAELIVATLPPAPADRRADLRERRRALDAGGTVPGFDAGTRPVVVRPAAPRPVHGAAPDPAAHEPAGSRPGPPVPPHADTVDAPGAAPHGTPPSTPLQGSAPTPVAHGTPPAPAAQGSTAGPAAHGLPWPSRVAAADALGDALAAEADALRSAHALAAGLLDRRAELRGRYDAFGVKARRLGLAEDAELVALDEQLRGTLWARPCDLAAATRALAAYQRLLQDAPGRERSHQGRGEGNRA